MQTIGFTTEFYTLWDVIVEPKYFTDSYGKHWLQSEETKYHYIKNISKDLAKAKSLHPDLTIDEELRGKTRSWSKSSPDLTPHILKFGKYSGKSIQEVAEKDLGYILWLLENARIETKKVCEELPLVIAHFEKLEKERQELMASYPTIESGEVEVTFIGNPNHRGDGLYIISDEQKEPIKHLADKYYACATIGENNNIYIFFDEVKEVSGIYPYNMAVINGKAMKLKNKTVKLNLNVLHTERYQTNVQQFAIINK